MSTRAITVWQPYAGLIVTGVKTVENRTWAPSLRVGDRIMIHAGKRYDRDSWLHAAAVVRRLMDHGAWRETADAPWPLIGAKPNDDADPVGVTPYGAIVGIVTLDEVLTSSREGDPWWGGPVGWYVRDPVPIEPVWCNGAQGLWTPPPSVVEEVERRVHRARGADEGVTT